MQAIQAANIPDPTTKAGFRAQIARPPDKLDEPWSAGRFWFLVWVRVTQKTLICLEIIRALTNLLFRLHVKPPTRECVSMFAHWQCYGSPRRRAYRAPTGHGLSCKQISTVTHRYINSYNFTIQTVSWRCRTSVQRDTSKSRSLCQRRHLESWMPFGVSAVARVDLVDIESWFERPGDMRKIFLYKPAVGNWLPLIRALEQFSCGVLSAAAVAGVELVLLSIAQCYLVLPSFQHFCNASHLSVISFGFSSDMSGVVGLLKCGHPPFNATSTSLIKKMWVKVKLVHQNYARCSSVWMLVFLATP